MRSSTSRRITWHSRPPFSDVIAWSIYRRRHQDAAKTSHYAHQALTEP
jgi:hypothetical protein